MAERNIEIGGYDIASFLAHQAVEKLLKSLLWLRGAAPPRTHHVDELARLLELPDALVATVSDLNIDYTVARYPDVTELAPFEEYTEDIAVEKVAAARRVFDVLADDGQAVVELVDE